LEYGADIHEESDRPFRRPCAIVSAVLLEHETMFTFLVAKGALRQQTPSDAMPWLESHGKELCSMKALFQQAVDSMKWN
ncbi:hypothetical protein, partial [Erythrobacter sp. YJ-T3-07]|uniref:hypothetical protein n=1 Tax=Erythrobacter sp. YJ-T3-07 TaxID=2793063 RepID=UPI001F31148E